jgi:hypothetical protein
MFMFKQAKQNRAFEDIISQIQGSILQGELRMVIDFQAKDNLGKYSKLAEEPYENHFEPWNKKG